MEAGSSQLPLDCPGKWLRCRHGFPTWLPAGSGRKKKKNSFIPGTRKKWEAFDPISESSLLVDSLDERQGRFPSSPPSLYHHPFSNSPPFCPLLCSARLALQCHSLLHSSCLPAANVYLVWSACDFAAMLGEQAAGKAAERAGRGEFESLRGGQCQGFDILPLG
jgi:hypothetical protein